MKINGWKYYNHAAIPSSAPHENVDVSPIEDGTIWQLDGKPLFARWTSDFDCGHETNWWYIIREAPFDFEQLAAKEKKSIRQARRKSIAKKIKMSDYVEQLYECYSAAVSKYEKSYKPMNIEAFLKYCMQLDALYDCWAGFSAETNELIGYITVMVYNEHCEIATAKFHPDYLKLRASDTLYFEVLDYYLNKKGKKYVSSGERSINHVTGTQEYKIRKFGYKKAYCKMHIIYDSKIKLLIKIAYPIRRMFKLLDKIRIVHLFNSVLKMEQIRRENEDNE